MEKGIIKISVIENVGEAGCCLGLVSIILNT